MSIIHDALKKAEAAGKGRNIVEKLKEKDEKVTSNKDFLNLVTSLEVEEKALLEKDNIKKIRKSGLIKKDKTSKGETH